MLKRTMAFVQFIIDIQLPIMSPIVNSPNVCDKVELALLDWVSIINNLVWGGLNGHWGGTAFPLMPSANSLFALHI